MKIYDVSFDPKEYGIVETYEDVKQLYALDLSPTIITLTTHKETEEVSMIDP